MSLFGIGAAAVANIAGGLIGTAMSGNSAKATASLQGQIQRENWEYAQKHAHQFEVEDLRAAGLNPILSATNGQLASMPGSVSASDNGVGSNVTSAFNALGKGLLEKEMQSKDLEIEKQRLENDALRLNNETRKIDADITYNNGMLSIAQANSASNIQLTNKQIEEISTRIDNSVKLTQAQVDKLRSGVALDGSQIKKIGVETKKIIEDSNLSYWQKQEIIANLGSTTRALQNMTAAQQLEYLSTGYGSTMHQFGYGLRLISPITGIGVNPSGTGLRF